MDIDYLITTCAADVSNKTMAAIVQTESGNHPWVINDNTTKKVLIFDDQKEVTLKAEELFKKGHNLDLGLAQINTGNLAHLNLSVKQVMEPCTNLKAASKILNGFYKVASVKFKDKQDVLFHAIAAYNTGSFYKGSKYAEKVLKLMNLESKNIPYNILTPYNAPIMVKW